MRFTRKLLCTLSAGGLAIAFASASPSTAAAAAPETHVCSGTPTSPGVLAGNFEAVRVVGACEVNAGPARVDDNLTVAPGAVLVAAFALNDTTGTGHSRLSVGGSLRVERGATLILGCDPQSFACIDDNPSSPTLFSAGDVDGSLIADQPLGVLVHNSHIGGSVDQHGGGGGFNCTPTGIFIQFNNPVFSAYEDSRIGGGVSVTGLTSCWMGLARLHVGGDVRVINDQLADPDGPEILSNHIAGDLSCFHNSTTWDSSEASFGQSTLYPRTPHPNTVLDDRQGQCVLASPATQGGPSGPGRF
jgi:hypothetical protein